MQSRFALWVFPAIKQIRYQCIEWIGILSPLDRQAYAQSVDLISLDECIALESAKISFLKADVDIHDFDAIMSADHGLIVTTTSRYIVWF